MNGSEVCGFSFWWIFPLVMMFLCFFMMRGRRGSMMCCFGPRRTKNNRISESESASEMLGSQKKCFIPSCWSFGSPSLLR